MSNIKTHNVFNVQFQNIDYKFDLVGTVQLMYTDKMVKEATSIPQTVKPCTLTRCGHFITDTGNAVKGGQYAKNIYLGETRIVK